MTSNNKNTKPVAIFLHFASFAMVCLMSCNYVFDKKDTANSAINDTKQELINNHKQQAKLLVKVSQNNLDVIKLCQLLENTETENNIEILAKDIESTHLEIFKHYKAIARENLISIPSYSSIENQILNKDFKEDKVIINNLTLINKKISNQIELLNKLSKTTENESFKELSAKTNPVLKSKLDKTTNAIHNITKA